MKFSIKRLYAIFQKDVKDILKNLYVSTMIPVPLVLAFIAGRENNPPVEAHYVAINLTFVIITAFLQCSIIAEEKEKNTLRGLMLSPASTLEILGGKSLLTFLFTGVSIILGMFVSGYQPANIFIISIAITVSIIFYIALGTLLGLMTKSVVEASVLIMPFLFIFGFGTFLQGYIDKHPVLSFVEYLPNIQLVSLANEVEMAGGIADVWSQLAVITMWAIVAGILVVTVYKRREMDK
ncbi:ABC transporter permease [Radiobacillus sp. PE A8.2]|uniref:ABC transporter permease n=1 Tax=Radiobacillus sp. PE A8.2 TaxID=3380349 RepID=UPI00388E2AD5